MKNLKQDLSTLRNLGLTPDKKKGALTQKEIDQAEEIFCQMINRSPAGLRVGLSDPDFSHSFLQLFCCKNERRVSQLTMALGNAISKKCRTERGDLAMAAHRAASWFPHLSGEPGVQKMVNHLMARSNERIAA